MRILLVEDNRDILANMADYLQIKGYTVDCAQDGLAGLRLASSEHYDLLVLDIMLPGIDGYTLCRRLREDARRDTPVIMLTARDQLDDRLQGFQAGADDYLVKPFRMEELLARVRALIRRAAGLPSAELACGPVVLNTRSGKVTVDGAPIRLTAQEYRLLAYLMHHPDKVISRSELTEHIYDQDFDRDSNTIEVFVNRIRKKLPVDIIKTVRGLGYRVEAPAGPDAA